MSKIDLYSLGLKAQYTFQNFVVGPHNQMASAACQEVTKKPGELYNPLFIYGTAGIGKTHLIQSVAHAMLEINPKLKLKYITAERFASEVIAAISEDNIMSIRQHYSDLDLFIIDDIQFLAESKATQSEFFHIFNNLHEKNHQVIMAADRPPNQLTMLDQSIRSRLEWGLAVDVKIPDIQTRILILKVKQTLQGLSLTEEVLAFVAEHLQSNVRELEGFLKRLHAYVALSHQDLSMDLVRQVIKEVLPVAGSASQEGSAFPPQQISPAPQPPDHPKPVVPPGPAPTPTPATSFPSSSTRAENPPGSETAVKNGASTSNEFEGAASGQRKSADPKKPDHAERPPLIPPVVPPSMNPPPKSPTPMPAAHVIPPIAPTNPADAEEEAAANHKEIGAVFFYPEGKDKELESVHKKFQEVIKKHKLKFRLKRVYSHPYQCKGKVNYSAFVDVCKQNKVPVAIVVGPPPDALLPEQDFYDLLSVTLDVQGVSLQLVNWAEVDKDYRYLNLALDIALVRSR